MKIRIFPDENYKAIYFNGKTFRFALDQSKPIKELKHPEFFDVNITNKCFGNCKFCYLDCTEDGEHAKDVINKINKYFGSMSLNQRPFQVALGNEVTLHPEFIDVLKAFYSLGITPNYTTNGMHLSDEIIQATKEYCGGVAVSCHEHLEKHWRSAANKFHQNKIQLNFHIIISDKKSSNNFRKIYNEFNNLVDHFVLLPYGVTGRAEPKEINWEYMVSVMPEDTSKIAFGANFYPYLIENKRLFNVSLYEPEAMSKYICLIKNKIYKSSFHSDALGDILVD